MKSTAVVILNWNGRQHLEQFLPSVVQHTPPQVRIIVADNGSTDDSLSFIERHYPTIEIIRLEENYGFAEGYNRALEQVDAEFFPQEAILKELSRHEPRNQQAISMELSSDESCCSTGNNQALDQAGITQLSWQLSCR